MSSTHSLQLLETVFVLYVSGHELVGNRTLISLLEGILFIGVGVILLVRILILHPFFAWAIVTSTCQAVMGEVHESQDTLRYL